MTVLRIFQQDNPQTPIFDSNNIASPKERINTIKEKLQQLGVRFEQWETKTEVVSGASEEEILSAYQPEVEKLMSEGGYLKVDVVSLTPNHPQKEELRQKFLSEHTHSEDEVRFFVDGLGLFSIHIDNQVLEILCGRGDLIGVPANTRHWFDMGANPRFTAIRFFNNPSGWIANYTGSDIASRFSRLEDYLAVSVS
ncbi:MAG: cupin [Geminocystis sp.]|nr:cupin [Geminocystis sp.]HIK38357.1 cupin [Geminocystis sp. M7585_C2015_104]MCS7148738.1 cupin [Geminocystis sp.]MCX8078388.1 cupin [Geminocystis sp.]MDW8116113.1 cupin [Geminocystis sp.]